jgi:hypothetical protein
VLYLIDRRGGSTAAGGGGGLMWVWVGEKGGGRGVRGCQGRVGSCLKMQGTQTRASLRLSCNFAWGTRGCFDVSNVRPDETDDQGDGGKEAGKVDGRQGHHHHSNNTHIPQDCCDC